MIVSCMIIAQLFFWVVGFGIYVGINELVKCST